MKFPLKYGLLALAAICRPGAGFAQTGGTNNVRTRMPQAPVTNVSQLDTIPLQRQLINISYTDGLGRALQNIQVRGSAAFNDVIAPFVYDNMGRQVVNYLPYARQGTVPSNAGNYQSAAVSGVMNFYNPASPGAPKIPTDASPYAQTVYEASPLGRVLEQGQVGTVFQPGTGHTVRAYYGVNFPGIPVYYFNIDSTLHGTQTVFPTNTLTVTQVMDENGHSTRAFKDLQGRTVMTQPLDGDTNQQTSYTYNDLGQLSNILTPAGRGPLDFINASYAFKYDSIGRVVEKLTPGKGWEYMVYNHSDKLVLSQDSNLRARHQWIYLKYDAEGRVVQTGIYTNATLTGRKALQYLCDNSYSDVWETWQPGTGYTNNAFPNSGTALYTTYYYDDYTFGEATSKPFQTNVYGTVPTGRTQGMLTGASVYVLGSAGQYLATVNYYDDQNRLIQQIGDNHLGFVDVVSNRYSFSGELTGSRQTTTALAGSPVTLQNRYVYDVQGRLLDTYTSLQGGAEVDISHNIYNETDQKVSEMLQYVGHPGFNPTPASAANIVENTTLTSSKTDIATNSVVLQPNFKFTAASGKSYLAAIGYTAAQRQEFRYNIRGWVTNINNGTLDNNGITQQDPNALFGESITYWEPPDLSTYQPQYNGNVSSITWRNKIEASGKPGVHTGGQAFGLYYDAQDRHVENTYFRQNASGTGFIQHYNANMESTGYDLMGNLNELYRTDSAASVINDQYYTYSYHGNKLDTLTDIGSRDISGTFAYDGNGNMTYDSHKGLTITYNYLDLPDTVTLGGSKLIFGYDAAGNKLYKKLVVGGTVTAQRHYVENLEVTATSSLGLDGRIDNVLMDEGRIVNTTAGFKYEYDLQDHLFNNRVSFRTDSTGAVQLSRVMNYYPFGSIMGDSTVNYAIAPESQYKYSGKEFQPELDLDTYDFGARHYEPVLGRWMGIDALGLQYPGMSPYNYVGNNPMNWTDPDGMQHSSPIITGGAILPNSLEDVDPIVTRTVSTTAKGIGAASIGLGIAGAAGQFIDAYSAFSQKVTQNNLNVGGVQGNNLYTSVPSNYNGSYMIPSSAYDYSKEEIPGKADQDLKFVYKGPGGTGPIGVASRYWKLLKRDLNAPTNQSTVQEADDVATVFLGVIPLAEFAKLAGKGYSMTNVVGGKYVKLQKVVGAGRLSGEARAIYVKIYNSEGKLVSMYKDTYKVDGMFLHRRFLFPNQPGIYRP